MQIASTNVGAAGLQHGKLLSQGATKVVCLGMKLVYDDRRIEVVLILQERARTLDLDSPGLAAGGKCRLL